MVSSDADTFADTFAAPETRMTEALSCFCVLAALFLVLTAARDRRR